MVTQRRRMPLRDQLPNFQDISIDRASLTGESAYREEGRSGLGDGYARRAANGTEGVRVVQVGDVSLRPRGWRFWALRAGVRP